MNEKNMKNAAGVFAKNAEIKELHFTNDGQAFVSETPAMVHQKEIGGKDEDIEIIRAGDIEQDAPDEKPKGKKGKEKPAE